jgi:hypothetical protein
MHATVPNTYAAAMASLAVWNKGAAARGPRAQSSDNDLDATHPLCECGNRRPRENKTPYAACSRCAKLDGGLDTATMEKRVIATLAASGEPLTAPAVHERLGYEYTRNAIDWALRRLTAEGKLKRDRSAIYHDGYRYAPAEDGR